MNGGTANAAGPNGNIATLRTGTYQFSVTAANATASFQDIYKGATIHTAFAGAGTPVNGSVTFTGISLATAQTHFTTSTGSVGGRSYLCVHYNA